MIPGGNPEKPIEFVEGVPVGGTTGGSGPQSVPPQDAGSGLSAGVHEAGIRSLPSYSQILTSDDSVMQKASALYQGTVARVKYQFASVKPWREFFDRSFFASPQGTSDVVNRLSKNITYFYSNYIILSLICSCYVLLVNPAFAVGAMLLAFFYLYVKARAAALAEDETSDGKIYFGSMGFTPTQLYLFMLVFGVLMFYLTSGSSVVFWLVFTSLGVTCAHAALRRPPMEEPLTFQLA